MIVKFLFWGKIAAFECIFDSDCRSSYSNELSQKFCSGNRCVNLLPPLSPCKMPQECSSYSYYGPLACSAQCGTKNECGHLYFEKTEYCCKSVPLSKKCNPSRPRRLNGCSKNHICLTENGKHYCSEIPEHSWFMGAFLSIFGNCILNLGVNFQKKSYAKSQLHILTYPINTMFIGVTLYIIGKISSFSAYIFCNQSFLAGLSASGLISNSIFAPMVNNEVFLWNDGVALSLVFLGTFIIIANTSKSHNTYTICELIKMLKQTRNILWIGFIFTMILSLFLLIKFVEINSSWGLAYDRFAFLKSDSITFEDNGLVLKYLMIFVYVFLSSFIASFTTLSIKILGVIANRYFTSDGSFLTFTTFFFVLTLVVCTFGQIYWLNRALKHYDALAVVPIFHMAWTILSIFTASIYFQDFETYSKNQLKNFLLGIFIVFSGSIFLGLKIRNRNTVRSIRNDQ